ncbi:MAG TPA: hypothetical protein VJ276_24305 [Thermoanaerobaculia bacterium]|nr:hypothetical protein [Thermoanaerobaculia bacterium]
MRRNLLRHRFRVGHIRGRVPVLVHWSVPALCLFLVGVWVDQWLMATVAVASYLTMLLTHEVGHQLVAERRGCRILAIEIYPLHGRCVFEPWVRDDEAFVAWGGALAQFAVALPLAAYVILAGYTRFEPVNAILAILGFISPIIAALNLLPIAPLDGRRAWAAIPLLFSRSKRKTRDLTAGEALEEALRKARRQ